MELLLGKGIEVSLMKDFLSGINNQIRGIDKITNVSAFYKIVEILSQLSSEEQDQLITIADFLLHNQGLERRDAKEWERLEVARKLYQDLLKEIKSRDKNT